MERSFSCLKEGEKKIEPFQNGRGKKLDKLDGNDGCSNRCSRVLGACYRRARIRFKTIRCGRGCLLSLSAAPQPGTRERGRERESFPWRAQNRTITCHVCVLSRNSKTAAAESCILDDERPGNPFSSSFVRQEPSYFSPPPSSRTCATVYPSHASHCTRIIKRD